MKIGIKYLNFYDCSGLVYALAEGKINYICKKVFKIEYQTDEYIFSQSFNDLKDVDKTIILLNDITQYSAQAIADINKTGLTNYKMLQIDLLLQYLKILL
mgnify:CR=1 FL=1